MIPGTLFTHTVLVGIPIAWAAQRSQCDCAAAQPLDQAHWKL